MLLEAVGTPPSQDNFTVEVVSIADRARKTLARGVGSPRYLPSGHLVYTKKATMFAVPFDLERMETRGTAVAVLDDVAYDPVANGAQYDVSRTGTLVYRRHVGGSSPPCSGSIRQASRSRCWPRPAHMWERPACRPMAGASRSPFRMAAIRTSGSTSPGVMR